jgi:two-component system cell cycle sensor histidine kinase/response regulator CckA
VEGVVIVAHPIKDDPTLESKDADDALRASEARYRRLFETSQDGILILDAHSGLITDVNRFLIRLLDYPREDFLGKTLRDIGPFRQIQESKAAFRELQDKEYIRYENLTLETRTGPRVNVEFVSNVYRVNGKRVIQCNIRDITERKLAEESFAAQASELARQAEELGRSRQSLEDKTLMLQSVLDSMSDGLVVTDERGKVVTWNPAADKLLSLGTANIDVQEWSHHYGLYLPDTVTPFPSNQLPLTRAIYGEASTAVMFVRNPELAEGIFVEAHAGPLKDKHGVVNGGVVAFRDITERKLAEEALLKSEERFSKAFRNNPLAITISTEAEGRYLDVNDAFLDLLGYKRKAVIGRTAADLRFWSEPLGRMEMLRQLKDDKQVAKHQTRYRTAKGEIREAEVWAESIELDGQPCVLGITRDITEIRRLETQFRQAQKMEAVGRLAAGLAHDFNNILSIIMGYSDIALGFIAPEDPVNRYVSETKIAAKRAARLTRQLLAFSRQQVVFPKILDLNEVVRNSTNLFQQLVGEDVEIEFRPTIPLGSIKSDPGQIEQVLMNLIVNARDAMPTGGRVIIETGEAELDEDYASRHLGSKAGQHVVLVVSDTGCGMDDNVKSHIFEPFFTTKSVGQGTGLGLSTVYGIVKQSEGYILVYSEPGKGTAFKIYFPRLYDKAEMLVLSPKEAEPPRGSETILVVEDDKILRELTVKLLQDGGYRVVEAEDAEDALGIMASSRPGIDLLLTDVVMLGTSGVELVRRAEEVHPKLRSLFMSGYTGDLVGRQSVLIQEAYFLEKPFTRRSLLTKVYATLHSEAAKPQ